ncbi:sulfite exporter TauE/SafE family protein [Candidatus Roizmanbacteria bacterium]|nr:sulfite exporter TauE/SafE family protein [Candidatus Roizmanbacteria bacterium]
MNKATVHIKGMHCRSCEILVEDELRKISGVTDVKVNEKKGSAYVCYEGNLDNQKIEEAVRNAGYELGFKEKAPLFSKRMQDYKELGFAFLVMVLLYMIGKELGIFNFAIKSGSNYSSLPIVFLVGLTAGISTCMALVGGLVLAASARFVEKHPQASTLQKFKPHISFNAGRIISFFVFGGIIGFAGSFFQLSSTTLGILTIAVGGVMVLMGLQLTEIFPRLNGLQFTLPKGISRALGIKEQSEKEYSHTNSFILGASTFFLPCGFTQAMQLFAISSGNPITGALTMGVFALGTAPGLLGIGGLTSVIKGAFAKPFFKFAGLIVIFMAVFNISNGLNLAGINVNAFLNQSPAVSTQADPNVTLENGVQVVKMTQNASGYSPNSFTIKKGIPVKWVVTSEDAFTCAASIVSSKLGIRKNLEAGENIIEFTPTEVGDIRFTCSMGMYSGSFNVIDSNSSSSSSEQSNIGQPTSAPQATAVKAGASCGGGGGGCGCGAKVQKQAAVDADKTPPVKAEKKDSVQVLNATYSVNEDVKPSKFTVKAGSPVRFDVLAKEDGAGCMGSIMIPGLDNNPQGFEKGKTTSLSFTPTKPGTYTITCAMGVPRGSIIVEL